MLLFKKHQQCGDEIIKRVSPMPFVSLYSAAGVVKLSHRFGIKKTKQLALYEEEDDALDLSKLTSFLRLLFLSSKNGQSPASFS